MASVNERISRLLWLINGSRLRHIIREAREVYGPSFARMTDGDLFDECLRVIEAPKLGALEGGQHRGEAILLSRPLGSRDAEALALAAEAFSRFPPGDLPRGSRLTDEQVLAAAHLIASSLVEMDAGEGKTFAISTAAFALLRLYERVYIVTANDYLASRDARQTSPFWDSVGASIGLGLRPWDDEPWTARVVYTTLSALEFRSLAEDLAGVGTTRTITWSAALLDEADAVLLDQSGQRHTSTRATAPTTKDWSTALQIAAQLKDEHIVRDAVLTPSVTLTPAGEERAVSLVAGAADSLTERLMLLRDVELACAATRVAREGHDYIVRAGRAVWVDPETGFLREGETPNWLPPLEQSRGLAARPRQVGCHATAGMSLLWRFEHLAGASGTIINEAIDYLLLVGLPPVVVPPRVPRHDGLLADVYGTDLEAVHRWISEQVAEQAATRPILIATDSIREAEALAEKLAAVTPEGSSVRAVSGKTIAEERVFERAGRPGTTIVSTRVAGRGVDIRLSAEARDAGGPLLISVGHASEARLDRQLLGRVGRHGEPFSARFVNHPDDSFSRLVTNRRWMRRTTSFAPDSVVESKLFTRQLTRAQRRYRYQRLSQFAGSINRQQADQAAYDLLRSWRTLLPASTDDVLPGTVVERLVERYLAARFPGFVHGPPDAVLATDQAAEDLALFAGEPDARVQLDVDTNGQTAAHSREIFTRFLTERIDAAIAANVAERERIHVARSDAERAVVEARVLRFVDALLDEQNQVDLTGALSIAVGSDADKGAVRVSDGAREGAAILVAQALESNAAPATVAHATNSAEGRALADLVKEVAGVVVDRPRTAGPTITGVNGKTTSTHDYRINGTTGPLTNANGNGDRDRVEHLRQLVEQAYEERLAMAESLDVRWRDYEQRSPWKVASETINHATQRLLAALDRTTFELSHTTSGPTYFRLYRRRVDALCGELEATLSANLIRNLLAARDPCALNELFAEREQAIQVVAPPVPDDIDLYSPTDLQRRSRPPQPTAALDAPRIIEHFVTAMRERMGSRAPEDRYVYPAFNEILRPGGSTVVLTEPDKVADAYGRYKGSAARDAIPPFQRRRVDKQVRLFLSFLNEKGLAAPLPAGIAERSLSLARRVRRTFSVTGFGLGAAALLGAGVLCAVLAVLPRYHPAPPAIDLGLLDRILSAGALSAGLALGPALLAIVGAAWARWFTGYPLTADAGQAGVERLVSAALLAVGAVLVVRPGHGGWGVHVFGQLLSLVILIAMGALLRGLVWPCESMVHLHLTAGMAAAFAGFAALPYLAQLTNGADVAIVAGLTAVIALASYPLRSARLPVVAIASTPILPIARRPSQYRYPCVRLSRSSSTPPRCCSRGW